jgi:DNA-binding MarR family transcriptional regulator/GNAT superfamily N-acetyltransferase
MTRAAIEQVRRFNRAVGERIGAIDDHFLGRGRPMGESRLLWEIGPAGADVRALRNRMRLDSGYLSRALRSLEREGLIRVKTSHPDRRVRRATLTKKGIAEKAELDRRSDALAASILKPLAIEQRASLLDAMSRVERLLYASLVEFAIEPPTTADAKWCLRQYFAELNTRFDGGFDPFRSISADADDLTRPAGALVLARLRSRPVACGALKFHGNEPAELKRMWVEPSARGFGLGARLLRELERLARLSGARVVRLETNRALREAIALYRRSGYVEVAPFNDEPYAHHWFEKRLQSPT